MGQVFRGFDPNLKRAVAIKTIRLEAVAEGLELSEMLDRFRVEAQAAASLNHPNVVTLHDFGDENNVVYIVMELQSLLRPRKAQPRGHPGDTARYRLRIGLCA
jgi:serine/threonine-protein kinase